MRLEVPFEPANKDSKNADLLVTIGAEDVWLDAHSIHPQVDVLERAEDLGASPYALLQPNEVVELIEVRAKSKYDSKYRPAVTAGPLGTASVGLLLSILKWEQAFTRW